MSDSVLTGGTDSIKHDREMTSLLFICESDPSPVRMAEACVRARQEPGIDLIAGIPAGPARPSAVQVMREAGLDCAPAPNPQSMQAEADIVVAMDALSDKTRARLSGHPEIIEWHLDLDMPSDDSDTAALETWRGLRDTVQRLTADLFEHGYVKALKAARLCSNTILDNISDGIVAHTMNRRIFFFNKAAESITGYTREEVIDKDCHDVFPGKFCGGKCLFCDGAPNPLPDTVRRTVRLVAKSGEDRDVAMTVKAMRNGSASGPPLGMLISFRDLTRERYLERRVGEMRPYAGIVSRDKAMRDVFDMIRTVADSAVPVLIQGESGTGKELVAAAIHNEGARADKMFVPVNCGALPESLLESELFGHVKGAFTGAVRDKKGRFELADGGTIFLDEIGDISLPMQVKLLRVLQEGRFERVGGETTLRTTARIVSATNKDLTREIADGRFREDLYYRLNVVPIVLPPLRERRNDIPLLAEHILKQALRDAGRSDGPSLSSEAIEVMLAHDWPGNVRELQNWIQFALVKAKGPNILPEHLPPATPAFSRSVARSPAAPLGRRRKSLDDSAVRDAMRRADGNKVEAAKLLGVSRATLYRYLDRAGLMA